MIGLDTNVLVRYIAQDDRLQSARAVKLIEEECSSSQPAFVSLITLVELVWVSESCYSATRKSIIDLLRRLFSTKQIVIQDAETAWKALRLFEAGQADFADCLVAQIAKQYGCDTTLTFDKTAAKSGMTILK